VLVAASLAPLSARARPPIIMNRRATQRRWLKPAFSPIHRAQLCSAVIHHRAGTPSTSF